MVKIPEFKSLTDLMAWATKRGRAGDLSGALTFLQDEIAREAAVLQQRQDLLEPDKKTAMNVIRKENFDDAVSHFLEEINALLSSGTQPEPINHWTVMLYRRKSAAWAVACRIYEVELAASAA